MAYCVQCGEPLKLDASECPACKRPVGLSSIGTALERRPSRVAVRAAKLLVALVVLSAAAAAVLWALRKPGRLEGAEATQAAVAGARSLVRVKGPTGESEGLVVRELGPSALVATRLSAAPAGAALTVAAGPRSAAGFCVLAGRGRALSDLALVLVPEAAGLDAREIRSAGRPAPETPVVAVAQGGLVTGSGRVLSFEDGPGAGTLVHDAALSDAEAPAGPRAYGLFGAGGRLLALPTFAPAEGEGLAVAASALLERLLAREVALDARVEWSELPFPIEAGTQVALVLSGPGTVQARVGAGGRPAASREVAPGAQAAVLTAPARGLLQVGLRGADRPDAGARRAVVVALAPLLAP